MQGAPHVGLLTICHAAAGGHDRGGGEDETHEREHRETDSACFVPCRVVEDGSQWSVWRSDHICKVAGNKEQAHQEDETCGKTDSHAINHDLRAFNGSVGDLLDHVCSGVKTSETQTTLKKTEEPGDAVRPAGLVAEICEYHLGRVVVRGRTCQNSD